MVKKGHNHIEGLLIPVTSVHSKLRQEDQNFKIIFSEFETSLCYRRLSK